MPAWQVAWRVVPVRFGAELCVLVLLPMAPCPWAQVAVCNLASIALNMYVTPEHTYDFKKLAEVTKVIVRNLNKIIDINYYPVPEVSAGLPGAESCPQQPGNHRGAPQTCWELHEPPVPRWECQCLPELQARAVLW